MPPSLSAADIDGYVRYRFRLLELLDLWALTVAAKEDTTGTLSDRLPTLHLVTTTWLAGLFDKNALQVLPVWKRLFPARVADIRAFERVHRQKIAELVDFRDSTGAHADRLDRQNEVRRAAAKGLGKFMDDFLTLTTAIAREEKTVPQLEREIAEYELPPGDV